MAEGQPAGVWEKRLQRVGIKLEQERKASDDQGDNETRRQRDGCWVPEE